jgi:hypothetical protein
MELVRARRGPGVVVRRAKVNADTGELSRWGADKELVRARQGASVAEGQLMIEVSIRKSHRGHQAGGSAPCTSTTAAGAS